MWEQYTFQFPVFNQIVDGKWFMNLARETISDIVPLLYEKFIEFVELICGSLKIVGQLGVSLYSKKDCEWFGMNIPRDFVNLKRLTVRINTDNVSNSVNSATFQNLEELELNFPWPLLINNHKSNLKRLTILYKEDISKLNEICNFPKLKSILTTVDSKTQVSDHILEKLEKYSSTSIDILPKLVHAKSFSIHCESLILKQYNHCKNLSKLSIDCQELELMNVNFHNLKYLSLGIERSFKIESVNFPKINQLDIELKDYEKLFKVIPCHQIIHLSYTGNSSIHLKEEDWKSLRNIQLIHASYGSLEFSNLNFVVIAGSDIIFRGTKQSPLHIEYLYANSMSNIKVEEKAERLQVNQLVIDSSVELYTIRDKLSKINNLFFSYGYLYKVNSDFTALDIIDEYSLSQNTITGSKRLQNINIELSCDFEILLRGLDIPFESSYPLFSTLTSMELTSCTIDELSLNLLPKLVKFSIGPSLEKNYITASSENCHQTLKYFYISAIAQLRVKLHLNAPNLRTFMITECNCLNSSNCEIELVNSPNLIISRFPTFNQPSIVNCRSLHISLTSNLQ